MKGLAVLTLVLLLWCGPVTDAVTDPVLDPTHITDQHNNQADEESNINWAPMPEGIPYVTNVTRDDGFVGPYLSLMRSFVRTLQPKDIDFELVSSLIKGETDIASAMQEMGIFLVGYGICLVIGILFTVFFPLVGCCFCCCRMCGKCSGKKVQKEPIKDCKCVVFTVIIDIMVIGIFSSALMMILMDDKTSFSLKYLNNATDSNIKDVKSFLANTADEVEFVAVDGFNFTRTVLVRDLNNIGSILGVPVRNRLDSTLGINNTIQEILEMDNRVDSVTLAMEELDAAITDFTSEYQDLDAALDAYRSNLESTLAEADCTSVAACNALIPDAALLDVNPAADPALLPSLASSLADLHGLQAEDMTGTAMEGKKSFDELPWQVQNDTKEQAAEIDAQLSSFSSDIESNIAGITELRNNSDVLNSATSSIEKFTNLIDQYDVYRSAGFFGLAALLMLLVLFFILGLCIGPCCYNGRTPPTERKCCSNCVGILLMAAAGISWILAAVLMIFTFLPFMLGYPLDKFVCEPLTDPEYKIFQHLLDGPQGLLSEGYFMGELLYGNGSIDVTLSSILESCKENQAAYQALQLQNLIDLDQVTNYEESMNISQEINKMTSDMSNVELISQDTIDQLNTFSSATDIDYAAFYLVLGLPLTQTDLEQFHSDLEAVLPSLTAGTTKTNLQALSNQHKTTIDNNYVPTDASQSTTKTKTEDLEAVAGTVPSQVNTTIEAAESMETNIQTGYGDQILKEEVSAYETRIIGVVDGFVEQTKDKFENELGTCVPIWNVWDSLVVYGMCNNLVDAFNGFWFTLGIATFCIFFAIIFSIKLAKYYRTMKHLDGEEEEERNPYEQDGDDDYPDYDGYGGKGGMPPPVVSSQPYGSPGYGAVGKAGAVGSPPPSYSTLGN